MGFGLILMFSDGCVFGAPSKNPKLLSGVWFPCDASRASTGNERKQEAEDLTRHGPSAQRILDLDADL